MQIGIIGLGCMGGNIARRLMKAGHQCVVFDSNPRPREELAETAPPRPDRWTKWSTR
jgi:6-phosphogluconate dehydrogenase